MSEVSIDDLQPVAFLIVSFEWRTLKVMLKQLVGCLTVCCLLAGLGHAQAQQTAKTLPRVGFVSSTGTTSDRSPQLEAFTLGLRSLGYVDGESILIERRSAEGRLDRIPALVQDLVQQKVDLILATNNVAIRAAQKATKTIPIILISSLDPVAAGYVDSFSRPGGNITGLAWLVRDLSAKRVEILKTLLPKISKVGALWDADGPGPSMAVKEYEQAAHAFKVDFRSIEIRGPNPDLAGAFQAAKSLRLDALIVVTNPLIGQHAKQIFALATKNRLPTMAEEGQYVTAGGLISYGANLADLYRRAAEYVVDVLKGAKPGDLPVKLASKFEIFINLRTSQQIHVVVPQHLLVQADKVVQN
jgi:putative tryptophan/tyrosine transport system substrate-binding protein